MSSRHRSSKARKRKRGRPIPIINPDAGGIDVGATEVYVAVPADREAESVRSFLTFTEDLHGLADWLDQYGVTTVAMESTSVYWLPLLLVLEKRGISPSYSSVVTRSRPESQILKTRKGWVQGYNGQIMVDCSSQVIVAQHVTNEANDVHQLSPLLEGCEEANGARPEELLADAGYWSEENVEQEADENPELFIATTKDWKRRKALREQGPPRGRIPKHYGLKERMERKLRTKRGREIYKERSHSVEPVFGQMVMRGLGDFLLRGMRGASGEWSLFSATHNLLKLWRTGWRPATAVDPVPLPA